MSSVLLKHLDCFAVNIRNSASEETCGFECGSQNFVPKTR